MKTATTKELRTHASAILDRVRKGDEVVITMRGKSIAVTWGQISLVIEGTVFWKFLRNF